MEEELEIKAKQKKWIYFLRQLMICSGVWTTFFMVGQFIGAPTVFVPQLRRESTEPLDDEMASWLYSAYGFPTIPCVFILSVLSRLYGLRMSYIIGCISLLFSYIIFYLSTSPLHIIISEIVFSIGHGSVMTIGIIIISEYTSPEYRGMFLTIKSASLFWGVWSANTIGTFFHWKSIGYSGFLCSAYTFTFVFWPESPHWLASRGRFDECRKAFYWLHGHDVNSEREVEELIASRMKTGEIASLSSDWSSISTAVRTVKSKEFYAPLLLTTLLITQYHFSGKMVCSIYAIDILKNITGSVSTAYLGMLILDGVTVFSMYFGCFLAKILNRRTLYFTTTFTGVAFLFIISLYLYLVKLTWIEESKVLSIVLLVCFSMAMSSGPMIMSTSIYAELIPMRFKGVIVLVATLLFFTYFATLTRIAPYLFTSLGIHGYFLFYGVIGAVCVVLLYKYLPETKDKTLEQIERNFKIKNTTCPEIERLNINDNIDK